VELSIGSPGPVGCWPPDRRGRQSPGRCRCDPRGPPPLHAPPGISCDHHDWHSTPLAAYLKVQDIPLVDKNSEIMVTANEILTLHEKNSPLIDEDS